MIEKSIEALQKAVKQYGEINDNMGSVHTEIAKQAEAIINEACQIQADASRSTYEPYTQGIRPGQTLWIVDKSKHDVSCKMCKGAEWVDAVIEGEKHNILCPTCNGAGSIKDVSARPLPTTVDSVVLTFHRNGPTPKVELRTSNGDTIRGYTRKDGRGWYRTKEECADAIRNHYGKVSDEVLSEEDGPVPDDVGMGDE